MANTVVIMQRALRKTLDRIYANVFGPQAADPRKPAWRPRRVRMYRSRTPIPGLGRRLPPRFTRLPPTGRPPGRRRPDHRPRENDLRLLLASRGRHDDRVAALIAVLAFTQAPLAQVLSWSPQALDGCRMPAWAWHAVVRLLARTPQGGWSFVLVVLHLSRESRQQTAPTRHGTSTTQTPASPSSAMAIHGHRAPTIGGHANRRVARRVLGSPRPLPTRWIVTRSGGWQTVFEATLVVIRSERGESRIQEPACWIHSRSAPIERS